MCAGRRVLVLVSALVAANACVTHQPHPTQPTAQIVGAPQASLPETNMAADGAAAEPRERPWLCLKPIQMAQAGQASTALSPAPGQVKQTNATLNHAPRQVAPASRQATAAPGISRASDGSNSSHAWAGPNGRQAEVIPDGSDDDIVARRLRKAAQQETDPELKAKLWKEYNDYRGDDGEGR